MYDRWNVSASVVVPPNTGPVLKAGATAVVERAMEELEFELDYFQLDPDDDSAGVMLVGVEPRGLSEDELRMQSRHRSQ